MLQGFFLLARRQARQRAAALLIFLLLAAVMLVLAVRAVRAPAAVPADAASLVAGTDGTHLTISQHGEVILTTAIDVRTLPSGPGSAPPRHHAAERYRADAAARGLLVTRVHSALSPASSSSEAKR